MYKKITEGKAILKVPLEEKISKALPVFYNPVMEFNRTCSVLLLKAIKNKDMQIALPLAGTGARGIRFLLELPKNKIKQIWINDINKEAIRIIKQNLKLNNLKSKVSNKEASLFLLEGRGFDYIDIDPFGSPNVFLDAAIKRLSRKGILAVTATDAGALAGSFPKACQRKYWATPQRNSNMHETGLRILIRKVQLIGSDHDKALTPVLSYFKDHYFRVFFQCEKGKIKADAIMKQHDMVDNAGPLWTGNLWDKTLTAKTAKLTNNQFLKILAQEAKINAYGFYHIPSLCKKHKLSMIKKKELIKKIKNKSYKVAESHFASNSLRSAIPEKELIHLLKR